MQLAFQHRAEGPRSDAFDLMLLDTATGDRRLLVERVTYPVPRWSADGRRLRFEQRPEHGFVWRELDLETGAVDEVECDWPDVSALPGDGDCATRSPGGQWIAYRHRSTMLCVARADGSEVFALRLPFDYFAADSYWSPCGTRLAATLTAGERSGPYTINLLTGEHVRMSSDERHHVTGWSPDGSRVVTTRTRWHNPETYDYEWLELWLLDPDGSAAERLTDDGRCRNAAIRPAGEPPVANGEDALTFAWAQPLRSATDRPASGEATVAHVRLDPLGIMVEVRTGEGSRYAIIDDCASIPDAFAKVDALLAAHDFRPADDFTVLLPRYAVEDPSEELSLLSAAHQILAETTSRMWHFDRG